MGSGLGWQLLSAERSEQKENANLLASGIREALHGITGALQQYYSASTEEPET